MSPKKIVYLIGAGAIQGEMEYQGIESNITMNGISNNVYNESQKIDGEYYRLLENFGIPKDQDIELMMSLFENITEFGANVLGPINEELRKLFRSYLISEISGKMDTPRLLSSLLYIHSKFNRYMGAEGEEMLGILTINYDSMLEAAFMRVYGGINCGNDFISSGFKMDNSLPQLLKLHGSFNWKIQDNKLEISNEFEQEEYEDDYSGWIPPSVYKKPSETIIFRNVWNKANELLIDCDVLRVVGSSLRNEDWPLISLIFSSQILGKVFDIELIIPQQSAVGDETHPEFGQGVMQRLTFLGNIKPLSNIPIIRDFGESVEAMAANVFFHWLNMKINEIDRKTASISEDLFLSEMLYRG